MPIMLVDALMGRASAYFNAGLYDVAIADYSDILGSEHASTLKAFALLMRGEAYHQKNAFDQALSDFNNGLAASPTFHQLYIFRARLYITTYQFDLAVADCTTVLTLYPNAATAFMWRGFAYSLKKSYRLAEEDLSKAMNLRPEIMAYRYRADIYKKQGRFKEALADWRKMLELKGTSKNPRSNFVCQG